MTATTWSGHLLGPGTHASLPSAGSVPDGALYVCTTHNKIYKVVSAAWTDYATLGASTTVATDTIWDTKGDLVVATGADAASKLAVGSNNQVLVADSAQTTGVKWAAVPGGGYVAVDTIWDAKGDLAVGTGADTASRLAVGSNNQVLTADSAQTTGVKWATPSGGGVTVIDYTEFTSNVDVSSSSESSPTNVVVAGAHSFDGSTLCCIEFFTPNITFNATLNGSLFIDIYDGTTSIGRLGALQTSSGDGGWNTHFFGRRYLTPSNASHTYKIGAWYATVADPFIKAGAGGTTSLLPGYIRITSGT